MRNAVLQSIDLDKQPLSLLKRKGDVLSKIYAKLKKTEMLLAYLVQLVDNTDPKVRQFAMYVFEILSEFHLTSAQLTSSRNEFITIFQKGLNDQDTNVKVASLKAVTAFLSSIEEQEVVLGFASILDIVLVTVVSALQKDEEQGRIALESLAELTQAHPEVWKNPAALIDVTS